MKKNHTLEDVFLQELSDIYSAEKQLTKALPKMARAADNPDLSEGFQQHLEETLGQVQRIDDIADGLGLKLKRVKCLAMEGLVGEAGDAIEEFEKGPVRDVVLILGGQKVEHYEIASYGGLIAIAKQLGYVDAARLLDETLAEEKATDEKLQSLASSKVNGEAPQRAEQLTGADSDA